MNWLTEGPRLPQPAHPAALRLRRALGRLGVAAALVLVLVAVHRPLLVGFAHLFRVDDPAPSDAIVLLQGGPGHRPQRAAELYAAGMAPVILMGEVPFDPEVGFSEATLARRILERHHVPPGAIHELSPIVTSTRDEALRVLAYVRAHPSVKRITVVTTAFHTGRARWIFRKVLRGTGVDIRVAAARQPEFDENDWYTKDEGLVLYFSEAIKSLYYRIVY